MKMSEAFPSNFLSSEGFDSPITLTIDSVNIEEVGQAKEERPVLSSANGDKLILNKTNYGAIVEMYGDESNEWGGKLTEVFKTKTNYGGKAVDCLRVRAAKNVCKDADGLPF